MSDSKIKVLLYDDHKKPKTRRDFLRTGLIGFSAGLFVPNLLTQIFASTSFAQELTNNLLPFLVFDMAGGASLPGNFLVGRKGGSEDLLPSYSTLGWDPRAPGAIDKSFGIPMAAKASQILAGIKQTASAQAQMGLRMGGFCNFSQDDTSNNPLSALTLVTKAGYKGIHLPNGTGMLNSPSGGNSLPTLSDSTLKPLQIKSVDDIFDSISFGPAFKTQNPALTEIMAKAAAQLSASQAQRFVKMNMGDQLAQLSGAAYQKNIAYGTKVEGLDPRDDRIFQTIYQISPGSQATALNAVSATIVMNVLKNNTGPGCLTIGGCDYHDGTQTTGDSRDLEAGQQIGRAVEAAFQMQKAFFFQLLTDGGVSSTENTRNWIGESGVRSMTVLGFYNPKGAPTMLRQQVGNYTDGQIADQSTLVGGEPAKVGYASFANYLNVCGARNLFDEIAPKGIFTPQQFEDIQFFG